MSSTFVPLNRVKDAISKFGASQSDSSAFQECVKVCVCVCESVNECVMNHVYAQCSVPHGVCDRPVIAFGMQRVVPVEPSCTGFRDGDPERTIHCEAHHFHSNPGDVDAREGQVPSEERECPRALREGVQDGTSMKEESIVPRHGAEGVNNGVFGRRRCASNFLPRTWRCMRHHLSPSMTMTMTMMIRTVNSLNAKL